MDGENTAPPTAVFFICITFSILKQLYSVIPKIIMPYCYVWKKPTTDNLFFFCVRPRTRKNSTWILVFVSCISLMYLLVDSFNKRSCFHSSITPPLAQLSSCYLILECWTYLNTSLSIHVDKINLCGLWLWGTNCRLFLLR